MSFPRLIAIASIFWYNVQNHAIFGMNENGHTWFAIGPNDAFSHFIQHKNHVLDVEKISSLLVGFVTECALRCTTHVLCLSFNIKEDKNTENSRQITCELLPTNFYNASRKFHKSREDFHHWSPFTPCLHFPCKNDGTCVPDYKQGLYVCRCPTGYHGNNCQLSLKAPSLGKYISQPGLSCKDIADKQVHSQGDGEYWIAPGGSNNSFLVYCDMTTDGGGWILLKRFTIPQNLTEFWTKTPEYVASYSSISNYKDNFQFVSISAIEELRKTVNITQLRFYCFKKKQGSVVHVMTKNSSAGVSVLDYFLVNTSARATACGSFVTLPDDNSTLSQNCARWGHNGENAEVNEWGHYSRSGEWRLYRRAMRWNGQKSFSLRPFSQFWCDDEADQNTVSPGDTWEIYAR